MGECFITRRGGGGGGGGASGYPEFTYTGQYQLIDDGKSGGKQNWRVKFLTSGNLTFTKAVGSIDVFLVGGGGSGANTNAQTGSSTGGGGGGGYTTQSFLVPQAETEYQIAIGAGGASVNTPQSGTGAEGNDGGNTSAFGLTANGGKGGRGQTTGERAMGGSAGAPTNRIDSYGASDGVGENSQGSTTREFAETNFLSASVANSTAFILRDNPTDLQKRELSTADATVTINDVVYKVLLFDATTKTVTLKTALTASANDAVRIGALYAGGGGNWRNSPGGYGGGGGSNPNDDSRHGVNGKGGGGSGGWKGGSASTSAGGSGIVIIRNHRG